MDDHFEDKELSHKAKLQEAAVWIKSIGGKEDVMIANVDINSKCKGKMKSNLKLALNVLCEGYLIENRHLLHLSHCIRRHDGISEASLSMLSAEDRSRPTSLMESPFHTVKVLLLFHVNLKSFSYGNRGRFSSFRFRRSAVPRTPPREIYSSSDEEDEFIVRPDDIPDLKERAKQADVLENFMGTGKDEKEYSTEMLIYEKEKEDKKTVCKKGKGSGPDLVIPGGQKTSTFSSQELEDSNDASGELAFLGSGRHIEDFDKQTIQSSGIKRQDTYTNNLIRSKIRDMKLANTEKKASIRKEGTKMDKYKPDNRKCESNERDIPERGIEKTKHKHCSLNESVHKKEKILITVELPNDTEVVGLSGGKQDSKNTEEITQKKILSSESDVCLDWTDEDVALDKKEDVFHDSSDGMSESGHSRSYIVLDMIEGSDTEESKREEKTILKSKEKVGVCLKSKQKRNKHDSSGLLSDVGQSVQKSIESMVDSVCLNLNDTAYTVVDECVMTPETSFSNTSELETTLVEFCKTPDNLTDNDTKPSKPVEQILKIKECSVVLTRIQLEDHARIEEKVEKEGEDMDRNSYEERIEECETIQEENNNEKSEVQCDRLQQIPTYEQIKVESTRKSGIEMAEESPQNQKLLESNEEITSTETIAANSFILEIIDSCITKINFANDECAEMNRNVCCDQTKTIDETEDGLMHEKGVLLNEEEQNSSTKSKGNCLQSEANCTSPLIGISHENSQELASPDSNADSETNHEIDPSFFGRGRLVFLDDIFVTGVTDLEVARIGNEMNAFEHQKKDDFVRQFDIYRSCTEDRSFSDSEDVPDLEDSIEACAYRKIMADAKVGSLGQLDTNIAYCTENSAVTEKICMNNSSSGLDGCFLDSTGVEEEKGKIVRTERNIFDILKTDLHAENDGQFENQTKVVCEDGGINKVNFHYGVASGDGLIDTTKETETVLIEIHEMSTEYTDFESNEGSDTVKPDFVTHESTQVKQGYEVLTTSSIDATVREATTDEQIVEVGNVRSRFGKKYEGSVKAGNELEFVHEGCSDKMSFIYNEDSTESASTVIYGSKDSQENVHSCKLDRRFEGIVEDNDESTSSTWTYPLSEPEDCSQRSSTYFSQIDDEAVFHIEDTIDDESGEKVLDIENVEEAEVGNNNVGELKTATNASSNHLDLEKVEEKTLNTEQLDQEIPQNYDQVRFQSSVNNAAMYNSNMPMPHFPRPWFPINRQPYDMWPAYSMWQPFHGHNSPMMSPFRVPSMPYISPDINHQRPLSPFIWNPVPVYASTSGYSGPSVYSPSFMNCMLNGSRLPVPGESPPSAISMAPWMISSDNMTPHMQDQNPDTYFLTKHWVEKSLENRNTSKKVEVLSEALPVLDIPVHEIPLPETCPLKKRNNPKKLQDMCKERLHDSNRQNYSKETVMVVETNLEQKQYSEEDVLQVVETSGEQKLYSEASLVEETSGKQKQYSEEDVLPVIVTSQEQKLHSKGAFQVVETSGEQKQYSEEASLVEETSLEEEQCRKETSQVANANEEGKLRSRESEFVLETSEENQCSKTKSLVIETRVEEKQCSGDILLVKETRGDEKEKDSDQDILAVIETSPKEMKQSSEPVHELIPISKSVEESIKNERDETHAINNILGVFSNSSDNKRSNEHSLSRTEDMNFAESCQKVLNTPVTHHSDGNYSCYENVHNSFVNVTTSDMSMKSNILHSIGHLLSTLKKTKLDDNISSNPSVEKCPTFAQVEDSSCCDNRNKSVEIVNIPDKSVEDFSSPNKTSEEKTQIITTDTCSIVPKSSVNEGEIVELKENEGIERAKMKSKLKRPNELSGIGYVLKFLKESDRKGGCLLETKQQQHLSVSKHTEWKANKLSQAKDHKLALRLGSDILDKDRLNKHEGNAITPEKLEAEVENQVLKTELELFYKDISDSEANTSFSELTSDSEKISAASLVKNECDELDERCGLTTGTELAENLTEIASVKSRNSQMMETHLQVDKECFSPQNKHAMTNNEFLKNPQLPKVRTDNFEHTKALVDDIYAEIGTRTFDRLESDVENKSVLDEESLYPNVKEYKACVTRSECTADSDKTKVSSLHKTANGCNFSDESHIGEKRASSEKENKEAIVIKSSYTEDENICNMKSVTIASSSPVRVISSFIQNGMDERSSNTEMNSLSECLEVPRKGIDDVLLLTQDFKMLESSCSVSKRDAHWIEQQGGSMDECEKQMLAENSASLTTSDVFGISEDACDKADKCNILLGEQCYAEDEVKTCRGEVDALSYLQFLYKSNDNSDTEMGQNDSVMNDADKEAGSGTEIMSTLYDNGLHASHDYPGLVSVEEISNSEKITEQNCFSGPTEVLLCVDNIMKCKWTKAEEKMDNETEENGGEIESDLDLYDPADPTPEEAGKINTCSEKRKEAKYAEILKRVELKCDMTEAEKIEENIEPVEKLDQMSNSEHEKQKSLSQSYEVMHALEDKMRCKWKETEDIDPKSKVEEVMNTAEAEQKSSDTELYLKSRGIVKVMDTSIEKPVEVNILLTDKNEKRFVSNNGLGYNAVQKLSKLRENSDDLKNYDAASLRIKPSTKIVKDSLLGKKFGDRSSAKNTKDKISKRSDQLRLKAMFQTKQIKQQAERDKEKLAYTNEWLNKTVKQTSVTCNEKTKPDSDLSAKAELLVRRSESISSSSSTYSESSRSSCSYNNGCRSNSRSSFIVKPKDNQHACSFKNRPYRRYESSDSDASSVSGHYRSKQLTQSNRNYKNAGYQPNLQHRNRKRSSSSSRYSAFSSSRDGHRTYKTKKCRSPSSSSWEGKKKEKLKSGSKRSYNSSSSEKGRTEMSVRKYRSERSHLRGRYLSRDSKPRHRDSCSSSRERSLSFSSRERSVSSSSEQGSFSSSSRERYTKLKRPYSRRRSKSSSRVVKRKEVTGCGRKRSPSSSSLERCRRNKSGERYKTERKGYWSNNSYGRLYQRHSRWSKFQSYLNRNRNNLPSSRSYVSDRSTDSHRMSDFSSGSNVEYGRYGYENVPSKVDIQNNDNVDIRESPKKNLMVTKEQERSRIRTGNEIIETDSILDRSAQTMNRSVQITDALKTITQYREQECTYILENKDKEKTFSKNEHCTDLRNSQQIKTVLLKPAVLRKLLPAGLGKFLQILDQYSTCRCEWCLCIFDADVLELEGPKQETVRTLETLYRNLTIISDVHSVDSYLVMELRNPHVLEIFVIIEPPDEDETIRSLIRYCSMEKFLEEHLSSM